MSILKLRPRSLVLAGVLVSACVASLQANAAPSPNPPRTNVVLILIDDLGHYGVTAYGAKRIRSLEDAFPDQEFATPNIDRIAREGLRCGYAFTHPLCENTRVALMTGMNNDRNYLQPKSLHASSLTFGDTFRQAGYATGLFGKWKQSRGSREIPAQDYLAAFGWDESIAFDVVDEGQRYINPNLVVNGKVVDYTDRTDLDPATGRRWYGPDIVNRGALEFIERHRDEPFFLYYPMILVHDEHQPTPDTRPAALFNEFDEAGDDHRYFPDMIAYTDKLIGRVVDKLDELKLRERTLIVVMGDNGTKECYAHLRPDGTVYPGRKGGNADNGLHVPLVLSQPGAIPTETAGRVYDGLVDVTDLYPTIAESASVGIPNTDEIDGVSFWPQATGEPGEHRQSIYRWYIGNYHYTDVDKVLRFAFSKHFKRYAPTANFPDGRFFDLRTDPLEREGDRRIKARFNVWRHSGLPLDRLTAEQRKAYDKLGRVLAANELKPVERLELTADASTMRVGQTQRLHHRVLPPEARRRGVVWESSNPSVATVDKFGKVTAQQPGQVQITLYSWDDAEPLAASRDTSYRTTGVKATTTLKVVDGA